LALAVVTILGLALPGAFSPAQAHPGHAHGSSTFDAARVVTAPSAFASLLTPLTTPEDACGSVQTGRVFVTGHDPDYHASAAGSNLDGARHILQKAVAYVTADAAAPSLLLVTSTSSTGEGTVDPRTGLTAAGLTYDVAHAGAAGAGVLDLSTVDFGAYDAVIVASDFGGWLSQAEVNGLNARASALASYIAGGGGVVALAESVVTNAYGFLPFLVSHVPDNAHEDTLALTTFGGELGLVAGDINGNFYHATFSDGGVLQTVDLDTMGTQDPGDDQVISLAGRLCSTLTVKKVVVNDNGGQALPSSFSLHVRSNGSDVAGSPQAGTTAGTTYALAPGAYTVGEDTSPAYNGTIGEACAGTGAITLSAGEDATCVVTNDDKSDPQPLPAVTLVAPADGALTKDTTPTYSGAAGNAAGDSNTVTAKIWAGTTASGSPLQTIPTTRSGSSWTVDGSSALPDATYTARAEQAGTNGTGLSAAHTFKVDATAPVVAVSVPAASAVTADTTPDLSGTAGNAAADPSHSADSGSITVKVYSGNAASGSPVRAFTVTRSATAWSVGDPDWTGGLTPLTDGTYTVQAEQSDGAGNTGFSNARTFTVDDRGPDLHISTPVHQTTIRDATPTYLGDAGTAPGDAGTVTVDVYAGINPFLQGTPVQTLVAPVANGIWTVDGGPAIPDGTYTIRASQFDSFGHFGSSNIPYFTIDTTGPAVAITAPANGSSGTDTTPTISGSAGNAAGDGANVTVLLYSGSTATGTPLENLSAPRSGTSWTIDAATLALGTYTVVASQADSVGNMGTSTPVTFTITGPPKPITIIDPISGITAPRKPVVITDFLCMLLKKCPGLPFVTTFTAAPGNGVWHFDAIHSLTMHGGSVAARNALTLGTLKKRITKTGKVKVVFKVKGAKARKLLKQIRKLKLNGLQVKLTYTPDGKKAVVKTTIVKLRLPK
jgi:hypothetical protein